MTAVRTSIRELFQDRLTDALGREFVGGPITGPVADRDAGCVWWEAKRPFSRDFNIEENTFRIRTFRLWKQDDGMNTQQNVVPLEEDAEALEAALVGFLNDDTFRADLLAASGEQFNYFNVMQVAPDYAAQSVEAVLTLFDWNRSATGG